MDTGYVIVKDGNTIEFYFEWGTKGGHLNIENDVIKIYNFYMDLFPTITTFDPK